MRRLKMVTNWPAGLPGPQSSAERRAQRIGADERPYRHQGVPSGTLVDRLKPSTQ
jgi:hypothetical protein